MTSTDKVYKRGAETAKSAADAIESAGEHIGDFASDVSRKAGEQLGRAQERAVGAFDDAHAAIRRNPLTAVGIALGVGFLLGIVISRR